MKNNVKKILMIFIFLISLFIFINEIDAKVMWVQCNKDGKLNDAKENSAGDMDHEDTIVYGTFAIINAIHEEGGDHDTRWLSFNVKDFYSGYYPVFIQYRNGSGFPEGQICWWDSSFHKFEECDPEEGHYLYSDNGGDIPLNSGICPEGAIQTGNTQGSVSGDYLVLYGEDKDVYNTASLSDLGELVIYGFQEKDGQTVDIIIEGYAPSGIYGYATTWQDWDSFVDNLAKDGSMEINNDSNDLIDEDEYSTKFMSWTAMTQARRVDRFKEHYFELTTYENEDGEKPWLIYTRKEGVNFIERTDKIYYTNKPGDENLRSWVSTWYNENSEKLSDQLQLYDEIANKEKIHDVIEEMMNAYNNGKEYKFNNDYSASDLLNDLDSLYPNLELLVPKSEDDNKFKFKTYETNSCTKETTTTSAESAAFVNFMCDVFGVPSLDNDKFKHKNNTGELMSLLENAIIRQIDDVSGSEDGIYNLKTKIPEYAEKFSFAISYLNKYANNYGLDSSKTNDLKNKYDELIGRYDSEIIIDCEGLIDEKLKDKITQYINIIKICVPILLIGFGVIDFTKALFSSDDEKMKKAQKDFILRLAIAILFFLLPVFVNLLLSLVNKVWYFIEPGTCGLF